MSFTDISQLKKNAENGSIVNGKGLFKKGHTFFYAEDIQKVLAQAKDAPEIKLSQLQIVNVIFEKNHGAGNHDRHDITVLALAKTVPEFDPNDNITNNPGWYDKVALPWPPYYDPESTALADEEEDSAFPGEPFSGHPDYKPGIEIHK
jgi:hypothetical protein